MELWTQIINVYVFVYGLMGQASEEKLLWFQRTWWNQEPVEGWGRREQQQQQQPIPWNLEVRYQQSPTKELRTWHSTNQGRWWHYASVSMDPEMVQEERCVNGSTRRGRW